MSDFEYDGFSGSRPYECVDCGRRMRTRGSDGRCYSCAIPVPVRCEVCARVRLDRSGDWQDHPGLLPGEVSGYCATCGERHRRAQERAQVQLDRQLLRERAAGYGPAPEGVDIFDGFRGE